MREWLAAKEPGPFAFPEDHRVARTRKAQHEEGCVAPDEASHHLRQTLSGSRWESVSGWHVFRHSFISNCATQGIDQRFIGAWVGHQTATRILSALEAVPAEQKLVVNG